MKSFALFQTKKRNNVRVSRAWRIERDSFGFLLPIKKPATMCGFLELGGEGGIRTPGRFDPSPDFKSGALNRALPPLQVLRILMIFL